MVYNSTMTDPADDIATNSQGPQSASGDGHSAQAYPISEQIEADRYKDAKAAAKAGPGVKYRKFKHRGTVF